MVRDPSLLQAIGRVTIDTSGLEYALHQLAHVLLAAAEPGTADAVTGRLDFRRLLDLIKDLAEAKGVTERWREIPAVVSEAHRLYDERNALSHSIWFTSLSGSPPEVIRIRDLRKWEQTTVDTASVEALAARLRALTRRVHRVMDPNW